MIIFAKIEAIQLDSDTREGVPINPLLVLAIVIIVWLFRGLHSWTDYHSRVYYSINLEYITVKQLMREEFTAERMKYFILI